MPTYIMFMAFVTSFSSANLALLSQYVGARMYNELAEAFRKMLFISVAGGVASGALFYVLAPYMFTYFVQTPLEILPDTVGYAQVLALDVVVQGFNMALVTLIQSMGDTRTTSISQMLGGLANVVLDPVFINGLGPVPAMGAVGAALATVLSKFVSIAMMLRSLIKHYPWIKVKAKFHVDVQYLSLTLRVATPLLVMSISNSFAFNLQNRLVNTFGVIAATAFSLGFLLFDLANTSLWGLTEGIAIMVGQSLGAGDTKRAKSVAAKTTLFIFVMVAASSLAIFFARHYIAAVFLTGQGVSPEDVAEIYREFEEFVALTIWTLAFFGLTFSSMSVGRGSGQTLTPTMINIIRLWGFRIGLGYLLALAMGLGTVGIYIAFALSNVVGGVMSVVWVLRGSWAKPLINLDSKSPAKPSEHGELSDVATKPTPHFEKSKETTGCSSVEQLSNH